MTAFDLAVYLRRSEGWLAENMPALAEAGFPKADTLFDRRGLYDKAAVDRWLDQRHGLIEAAPRDWEAELLGRIDDDDRAGKAALSR